MKRGLTLRGRILLPVLGFLGLGLVAMVFTMATMVGTEFRRSAWAQSEETAREYAARVTGDLGRSIETARSLAHTLQTLKASGTTNRDTYNALLKDTLVSHPLLLGVWTVWEPNALDGRDRDFVNKAGHDSTGRFIPTWYRGADGQPTFDPSRDYETPGAGDYYLLPKTTKKEVFLDPYYYSYTGKKEDEVYETSFTVPIFDGDRVVGVVGVDIGLKELTDQISTTKVFGTGYLFVTNEKGLRIAHPNKDLLGKVVGDDTPKEKGPLLEAIGSGKPYTLTKPNLKDGTLSLFSYVPVGVGIWDHPWSLAAVAPLKKLAEVEQAMTGATSLIGLVTFVLVGLAILVLVTRSTSPVRTVAQILQTIAQGEGDLTRRLGLDRGDEIGDLARSYDAFLDKLSAMIRMMQGTSVRLQSSGADLASALTETAASLHEIASNIDSAQQHVVQQESIATETAAAVRAIAGHVDTLQGLVTRQSGAVETSGSAVEEMVGNIESVTRNVETLDHSLKRLVEAAEVGREQFSAFRDKVTAVDGQSASLQETNEVIAAIASQTNLLAMNAAIEAAHAGEAGRGFAVVADEIRKLAEQSTLQSKSTATELKALQGTIRALVGDAELTEGAFGRILQEIGQVEAIESEVRSAMDEQQQGSRLILEGIRDIRESSQEVSQHSADMGSEASSTLATMEVLHRITLEVRQGMDEISIGAGDINRALALISEQGVKNKESVDELAGEAAQFKVPEERSPA